VGALIPEQATFLSISIDLVGSTPLKRAMFHAGDNDFGAINRLYERYVRVLFEIEERLYRYISASGAIDIRKLFLAKIIGDEYWYLYEVDPEDTGELNAIAHAFIFGLIDLLAQPRTLRLGDGGKGADFDLSLKAMVDLMTNALHLPDRRYAYFEDKIMDLLGSEARLSEIDPGDYAALCYGLNFRPARAPTKELLGVTRSDYVGMQIDRFFRAAKACKPRFVTLGEALCGRLDAELVQVEPSIEVHRFAHGAADDGGTEARCNVSRERIPAHEMTGIDHDYALWHLYNAATLREDIYRPRPEVTDFLAPTRAFLARAGFYGLARPEAEIW
jgi:hypothetical protein